MKKTGVKSDYKGRNNSLRLFVHMVDWVLADDCEEVEKELSLSTKPKDFRINGGRDDLEESLGFLQVLQGSHASGLPSGGVPPMEVLRAQLESLPAPPDPAEVKTDVEFDHTAAAAAERGNQGQRPVRRRAPVAPARQPRRPRPAALGAGAVAASIPESNSLLEVAQRAGHQPSQPDREHSSNSSSGRGLSSGSGSSSSSSSSSSGSSSS